MTEQERRAFIHGLSFEGEIEDCKGVFKFTVKKDLDLVAAFECFYASAMDPPLCRIDAAYRICDQQVWHSLGLEFGQSEDSINNIRRIFPLSDEERECVRDKMNDYCLQQTGVSLLEYGILHWSEDDGPRPSLAGPTTSAQSEQSASQPISGFDLMEAFAIQCVEQMVQGIQSRVTPEEWEELADEARQTNGLHDQGPELMCGSHKNDGMALPTSGPIQVPMPGVALPTLMKQGGKRSYNLNELEELIGPVYRVYKEQISRCISGLTAYAAQCAAARHEEQIPKLREHIVMMGGFWGTEEDVSVDPYAVAEQRCGRSFDAAIAEARQTGAAPPLAEQVMRDVLTGLEVHMQEMENSGDMDDLIDEYNRMAQRLRTEWHMEPPASQQTVLTMEGMSL